MTKNSARSKASAQLRQWAKSRTSPQGLDAARRKLASLIDEVHPSRTRRLRQAAFFLSSALPWIEASLDHAHAEDLGWLSEGLRESTDAMRRLSLLVADADGEVAHWNDRIEDVLAMLDRVAQRYAQGSPDRDGGAPEHTQDGPFGT